MIINRVVMIYLELCIYTAWFYLLLIRGDLHTLNGLYWWGGLSVVWKEGKCFRIMKHNGMWKTSPSKIACGSHHDLWWNRQNMEGKPFYAFLLAQKWGEPRAHLGFDHIEQMAHYVPNSISSRCLDTGAILCEEAIRMRQNRTMWANAKCRCNPVGSR